MMNDPNPMNERPLPNELRSVEAMFASLVPRVDRLDQEQLWFEAGKRAAMGSMSAPSGVWAIAGSSAVSAAVAIAATLLVMLWTQTPVRIVEQVRIRERPAVEAPVQEPKTAIDSPAHPLADAPTERRAAEPPSISLARSDADQPRGSRAAQLERMVLLVRHGVNHREPMSGATTSSGSQATERAHEPPTYYQQRQDLLGDQASHRSGPAWGGPT